MNTAQTDGPLHTPDGPSFILIRGLPGSGKSYLAHALEQLFGTDKVLILDPDDIDHSSEAYLSLSKKLTAEGVEAKFHPHRFLYSKAYEAIRAHKIIIWTQAFTHLGGFMRTVINLQTFAIERGLELPTLVVEMEVSHAVAKQRVAQRAEKGGHDVNEEAFARFINDYRSFAGEGFATITVHGEDDVATSVAAVRQALEKLWAAARR